MVKLNGDHAYEEMAKALLDRASDGEMSDEEFKVFVVASLAVLSKSKAGNEQVISSVVEVLDQHPPILWLFRKRPKSTIPFVIGLLSLMSSLFISDIRMYILGLLGFDGGELPVGAPGTALAIALGGFVLSVIFSAGEKSLSEEMEDNS